MSLKKRKKLKSTYALRNLFTMGFVLIILLALQGFTANSTENKVARADVNVNEDNDFITASDLKIGDRLVDKSWQWEHRIGSGYSGTGENKPVTWIVVSKNHYGMRSGVTLLAEELIGAHLFDDGGEGATKASNAGSNHWGNSGAGDATHGIRPWLNGEFLGAFSERFKESLITVNLPNIHGDSYITRDKVFIPSTTELGDLNAHWTYEIGRPFPYFRDTSNSKRTASLGGRNIFYWTRSPFAGHASYVRGISSEGDFGNYFHAHRNIYGVRPVVCIESETPVIKSDSDEEGLYEIMWPSRDIDAEVSPSVTAFALDYSEDIALTLNRGTRNLLRITANIPGKEESEVLIRDEHYKVEGNKYVFAASYFEEKGVGDLEINFLMNGGENPRVDVKILDREDNRQFLRELRIGDRLTDKSWRWEYRYGPDYTHIYSENIEDPDYINTDSYSSPIRWIITAKDHYGHNSGYTLLSEDLIGRYHFDSSDSEHYMGSSYWGKSSIRSWLNDYFYSYFSVLFRRSLVQTAIPYTEDILDFENVEDIAFEDTKRDYYSEDKVFLPSEKEINGGSNNASASEKIWPFFKDAGNAERQATLMGEYAQYWTRTPYINRRPYLNPPRPLKQVFTTGQIYYGAPYNTYRGIRPAVNINQNNALISVTTNTSGMYEFIYPSEKESLIEPRRNITVTPGSTQEIILTLNDQFGNPLQLEPGALDKTYLEGRHWIESVDVEYNYGEDNRAKISMKTAPAVTGVFYPTIYVYGLPVFSLPRLESGYSDFKAVISDKPYIAGEPFTFGIEDAQDVRGNRLTGNQNVRIELRNDEAGYREIFNYEDVEFVNGRAMDEEEHFIFKHTPEKAGKYNITKTVFAVTESKTTEIEVLPADPEKVTLEPSGFVELKAGEEISFTAKAYDRFNNLITSDINDFNWSTFYRGRFMRETSGQYEVTAEINKIISEPVIVKVSAAAPNENNSIINPQQVLNMESGELNDITVTVYDTYQNPVSLGHGADKQTIWILHADGIQLEESFWIDNITYDYSYGAENEARIRILSSNNISGSADNLIIKVGEEALTDDYVVNVGLFEKISPSQVLYREGFTDDIQFYISGDTADILSIRVGEDDLDPNKDFLISGNNCIITESYLTDMVDATDINRITIVFSFGGEAPAIVAAEIFIERKPSVQPAVIEYFPNSGQIVNIYLDFNGRDLEEIIMEEKTLIKDEDYFLKGDAVYFHTDLFSSFNGKNVGLSFHSIDSLTHGGAEAIVIIQNQGNLDNGNEESLDKFRDYLPGDINKSGSVTVADAIIVLRHLVGLTDLNSKEHHDEFAVQRAMVSGNSSITVKDAIIILRKVVGLIDDFQ